MAETRRRTDIGAAVNRAASRARLALAWEGVWPWLAAALVVATLFLVVSWFGVWDALPPLARAAGVLLFGAAFLAALSPLARAAWPDRRAALARVDRASGLAHRPATSLDDRLASIEGEDPMTRALWSAHRERMERDAKDLRVGAPSPRLAARDPYALRFLVGLLAVAAFAVAGSDRGARVAAAFDWTSPAADTVPARIDAWVAPPGYTGRPPIFLTARAGAQDAPKADAAAAAIPDGGAETIRVPQNATLVVRGSGGPVDVAASGSLQELRTEGRPPEGVTEKKFKLTGDAEAKIASPGAPDRVWRFSVIPDLPPSIELTGPLKLNARGTAIIPYEVKDDYGVAAAEARFTLKPATPPAPPVAIKNPRPQPAAQAARPLYEAPKVALGLPRAKAREGKAETPLDVMEHPFAGADASMTLVARDEAGQEGSSKPMDLRLPAREFSKPLARALVEQRRILALDANAKPKVLQALRALALFPEQFTPKASHYLGLTTATRRLEIAVEDDALRGAADYLWEVALRIEDGDLPEAERDLRAAEEALRKALENGASEQEIKKLTQDLRAALEKFMREMAEQQRQNGNQQQQAQRGQRGAKEIRPQDLRNMIDKMEKLAQSGAKDAAKQALADLKNMLDNLRNAQRQQQADPNAQAQQQQLDKLQEMIREQGKLRDQTFQEYRQNERQQRNQRGKPQQGQDGQQRMKELAERQQQLRQQLDQMMRERGEKSEQAEGQQGQQQEQQQGENQEGRERRPGGERGQGQQEQQGEGDQPGQNALGEAGKSMGEAQGSLGQGQTSEALDQQQKALEQLRKGAQAMAEQMQGQGQPGQQGEGQQGAQNGEEGRDDDPLGRPVRRRESDGDTTKVPGEIDAQRARRVIEELRKRLGEADRPREELDYLERLLTP